MIYFYKIEKKIYFILCLTLWFYLCLRAIYIPLVHDEAATFFWYINSGKFLPFLSHQDANNHILNSALSVITYTLFGNSQFVLRLPNLLFAFVYFYYIFKLAWLIKKNIVRWGFILTMLTAHYFVEFFAFCRGYGISMALLIASIWYLYTYFRYCKTSYLILNLVLIFFAVSANLTLLITAIIMYCFLLLNLIINKTFHNKRIIHLVLIIIFGILPLALFSNLLFSMKTSGQLYYGSQAGFIEVTVKSLLIAFFDNSSFILICIFIFLFIFLFFSIIFYLFKSSFTETLGSVCFISFILLSGNITASILLNNFLKINYPEDRVGLYLFPFFFICLYFAIDKLITYNSFKILYVFCLFSLLFPVHFFKDISLEHARFWKNCQIPYRFYQKVSLSSEDYLKKFPPIVSGYRLHQLCWYYFDNKNGGDCSSMQSNDFPFKDADYLIIPKSNFPDMFTYYDSIDYYDYTKLYLLKRKIILHRELIDSATNINTHGTVNDEFFNIWSADDMSKYKNKSIYFMYTFTINSPKKPFEARIIVTSEDKDKNKLRYDFLSLDWLKKDWNGRKNNFKNCLLVYRLPENSYNLLTYIWNINKSPFSITDGKCYIYKLN